MARAGTGMTMETDNITSNDADMGVGGYAYTHTHTTTTVREAACTATTWAHGLAGAIEPSRTPKRGWKGSRKRAVGGLILLGMAGMAGRTCKRAGRDAGAQCAGWTLMTHTGAAIDPEWAIDKEPDTRSGATVREAEHPKQDNDQLTQETQQEGQRLADYMEATSKGAQMVRKGATWLLAMVYPTDDRGELTVETEQEAFWALLEDTQAAKATGEPQLFDNYAGDGTRLQIYGPYDAHEDALRALRCETRRHRRKCRRPGGRDLVGSRQAGQKHGEVASRAVHSTQKPSRPKHVRRSVRQAENEGKPPHTGLTRGEEAPHEPRDTPQAPTGEGAHHRTGCTGPSRGKGAADPKMGNSGPERRCTRQRESTQSKSDSITAAEGAHKPAQMPQDRWRGKEKAGGGTPHPPATPKANHERHRVKGARRTVTPPRGYPLARGVEGGGARGTYAHGLRGE